MSTWEYNMLMKLRRMWSTYLHVNLYIYILSVFFHAWQLSYILVIFPDLTCSVNPFSLLPSWENFFHHNLMVNLLNPDYNDPPNLGTHPLPWQRLFFILLKRMSLSPIIPMVSLVYRYITAIILLYWIHFCHSLIGYK